MAKLLITSAILLTTMCSSISYAEWIKVVDSAIGKGTYYLDFNKIKKRNGYIYYWYLNNSLKPTDGIWSGELYRQADCKSFKYKLLSYLPYKKPMGEGPSLYSAPREIENPKWTKPKRNSVGEILLKNVCDYVK